MSEITTLLSNEDVVILGPPSIVTVQTDIGPTGDRGSKIFVGIGHPNTNGINDQQDIHLNDIFINNLLGSQYSYMYQYVSQPAGNTWVPVLKVNPAIYSSISVVSFTSGSGTLRIPIANITDANVSSLVPENFSVQITPSNSNPTLVSITSITISGTGNDELVISLSGVEKGSSWQNLNQNISLNAMITMVSV